MKKRRKHRPHIGCKIFLTLWVNFIWRRLHVMNKYLNQAASREILLLPWEKYLSKRNLIKHTCSWRDKLLKNYGPFSWMGFNCLKATEPLRGGSLLLTTKSPGVPGTNYLTDLGRMKGWVVFRATQ